MILYMLGVRDHQERNLIFETWVTVPQSCCRRPVITLRPRQVATISQTTFSNAFSWMKIYEFRFKISLKFVLKVRINSSSALVQIMAWRRPGYKPSSEPILVSLLTHIRHSASCHKPSLLYLPLNEVEGGYSHRILVSPCPSVRLWTESCPLCIFYNTHRIHFIFTHLIKQLQKVCRV